MEVDKEKEVEYTGGSNIGIVMVRNKVKGG